MSLDLSGLPVLTLLIAIPLIGAIVLAFVPGDNVRLVKRIALITTLAALGLSLLVAASFGNAPVEEGGFRFTETVAWIPFFGIQYQLGIDGISLLLVVLTTLLTTISVVASFGPIQSRVKEYMISFLALEVGMLGVFLALDLFLFYIFWEIVLVPMYLIIGIWAGTNRIYATMKFVLYTLVGSLLMLVAILATAFTYYTSTGSWDGAFDVLTLVQHDSLFGGTFGILAFGAFFLAFAIKVPMFPFHTWLPDAHVEAPTAGSVILAGVLLKLGGYGFIRFAMPLYPQAAHDLAGIIVVLSLIAIIYGAIVAVVQPDLKKLIAYSSVSHMGFVTLGLFVFQEQATQGAVLQMVNHGIITGALFLCVGIIYERTHDRTLAKMGGLGSRTPVYAALFGFFMFASLGLPGLGGFVGEFLVFTGTFAVSPIAAAIATLVMVFAGVYLLWMYQRVAFGDVSDFLKGLGHHLTDIDRTEVLTLAPLFGLALVFGLFPAILLDLIQVPVSDLLAQVGSATAVTWGGAMTTNEWLAIAPFVLVVALAMLVVVVDLVWPNRPRRVTAVALAGLIVTAIVTVYAGPIVGVGGQLPPEGQAVLGGVYVTDQLTVFLNLLFIVVAALTILFAPDYLEPRGLPMGEFIAILLFAISGAMLIAGAQDLLILFIGLELLVLPGYMLAGFAKHDGLSTEGAIKYFLLGSFSSAILLFGLAFVFGYTGTTRIDAVAESLTAVLNGGSLPVGLAMGLALVVTGGAFKIAAVPFHYWTPDAYQGSPTPVTGYLSVGPKVAAFALLLRLLVEALGPMRADWGLIMGVLAALTMTLGNLSALGQDNIKRMLGYSSIAHTGYIMVGLTVYAVATDPKVQADGLQGVLFYAIAYTFMNLGAFACVAALQRRPGVTSQISSFAGLGRRAPLLGITMTLFLLSLVGIPPTAGFFAKAVIIISAVEGGGWLTVLAVIMMLNAAAAAFYYLRVVVVMYMRDAQDGARPVTIGGLTRVGLVIAAGATVAIGLLPAVTSATLDWTINAARTLMGA